MCSKQCPFASFEDHWTCYGSVCFGSCLSRTGNGLQMKGKALTLCLGDGGPLSTAAVPRQTVRLTPSLLWRVGEMPGLLFQVEASLSELLPGCGSSAKALAAFLTREQGLSHLKTIARLLVELSSNGLQMKAASVYGRKLRKAAVPRVLIRFSPRFLLRVAQTLLCQGHLASRVPHEMPWHGAPRGPKMQALSGVMGPLFPELPHLGL